MSKHEMNEKVTINVNYNKNWNIVTLEIYGVPPEVVEKLKDKNKSIKDTIIELLDQLETL